MSERVSVIIPTLNAGKELPVLLNELHKQRHLVDEIIVVDSASTDDTNDICREDETVTLMAIEREDFDHGRTRDMALKQAAGEIVVFMTQDAVPANDCFIGNLIAPLSEPQVAVSTGRQLPKADATKMEHLVRSFNYPERSHVRSGEDIEAMGIKAFFTSDVCAAYRKDIYCSLGGFCYPVKTNEDMFYAATALKHGYKVAYAADALVYHSHNYTLREQYKRNYTQGYEIEKHRNLIGDVSQESEGVNLVKYVSKGLLKHGHVISFIHFGLDCCARYLGNRNGRRSYRNVEEHHHRK